MTSRREQNRETDGTEVAAFLLRPTAEKIVNLRVLVEACGEAHARGERIVFTNGCFDLLHVGHLHSFESARREGDRLIVALNSDESVRAVKGEGRPLVPERERALLVAALEVVDWVTIFGGATPEELIRAVRPDVLVKGAEYADAELPGAAFVEATGGRVVLVPMLAGFSSSAIRDRLKKW